MSGERGDSLKVIKFNGATIDVLAEKLEKIWNKNGINILNSNENEKLTGKKLIKEWPSILAYGVDYNSYLPLTENGVDEKDVNLRRPFDMSAMRNRDLEGPKKVYLVVTFARVEANNTTITPLTPRHRHMAIRWQTEDLLDYVGDDQTVWKPSGRVTTLLKNHRGKVPGIELQYVNWGPFTKPVEEKDETHRGICIGELNLEERQALEEIARNTPVALVKGGGSSNCQNFLLAVAWLAVRRIKALNEEKVLKAFQEALKDEPKCESCETSADFHER